MSCNCTTTQELNKLYEKLGLNEKKHRKLTPKEKIKHYTQKIAIIAIMLLILPLLLAYVVYITFFGDGKISLTKFFNLKKNNIGDVGEQ
jgi:hypothetical protein